MSRIDIPTLKCDRCGFTTTDTKRMIEFQKIDRPTMGGIDTWDLCPTCAKDFIDFMDAKPVGTPDDGRR